MMAKEPDDRPASLDDILKEFRALRPSSRRPRPQLRRQCLLNRNQRQRNDPDSACEETLTMDAPAPGFEFEQPILDLQAQLRQL